LHLRLKEQLPLSEFRLIKRLLAVREGGLRGQRRILDQQELVVEVEHVRLTYFFE